jgi:hypothetical protein
VFAHIKARGVPGLVAFHPANGGYRRPAEAAILKGMGVTSGAPDVLLWHGGKSYAMELKSETGKATDAQLNMLDQVREAGVHTALVHGLRAALTVLEHWQLLRARLQ